MIVNLFWFCCIVRVNFEKKLVNSYLTPNFMILVLFSFPNEEFYDFSVVFISKTRVLWELLFTLFGVSWVLPSSVRKTLLSWHGSFVGKKRRKVWRAAPLYIFWTVWKARNRLAFKDDVLSI